MARSLKLALDDIQVSAHHNPAFRVRVYDVRSTTDTIRQVIQQQQPLPPALQFLTGPMDFTDFVTFVDLVEQAGDYAGHGVGVSSLVMQIIDPIGQFDPVLTLTDPTGDGRWLRRGNVITVQEGDARVAEIDWPITFTGKIVGQAGVTRSRAIGTAGTTTIQVRAIDRAPDFLKHNSTSESFGVGTTLLAMALDIAQSDMGLDLTEISLSGFGSLTTGIPITFVEEPPLVSLAKIMFVDGFTPRFRGDGVLVGVQANISKPPERVYDNEDPHLSIVTPLTDLNPPNCVRVNGISPVLAEIAQPDQELTRLELTTGYFTNGENITLPWGKDGTQLARDLRFKVVKSVNGGLSVLGGGEDFAEVPAEGGTGSVAGTVTIDTGFAPYVIIFLTVAYVILAIIPDIVLGFIAGETISVGRLIQAVALALVLLLMSKIGRGSYRFFGIPFEFIYEELGGKAIDDRAIDAEIDELVIQNHLCQSQTIVDDQAREVLFRKHAQANPRAVDMLHDLRLEPGDIFETSDERRFLIEQIAHRLARIPEPVKAQLAVSETTPGLFL